MLTIEARTKVYWLREKTYNREVVGLNTGARYLMKYKKSIAISLKKKNNGSQMETKHNIKKIY